MFLLSHLPFQIISSSDDTLQSHFLLSFLGAVQSSLGRGHSLKGQRNETHFMAQKNNNKNESHFRLPISTISLTTDENEY